MKTKIKTISLGKNVRRLRKEKGWTQRDLAAKLSCTQSIITAYENDVRRPPASKIALLAELFGTSVNDIFAGIQSEKNEKSTKDPKLWKRFERIQQLPPHEKRTVLKMIDGLLAQREEK